MEEQSDHRTARTGPQQGDYTDQRNRTVRGPGRDHPLPALRALRDLLRHLARKGRADIRRLLRRPGALLPDPTGTDTMVRPRLAEALRTTVAGIRESVLMHRTFAQGLLRRRGLHEDRSSPSTRPSSACSPCRWPPAMRRQHSTLPTALCSTMRRHGSTSAPMYHSTPCWGSASACAPCRRKSRWNARSREFWLHCQGLLFCLCRCSYPPRQSRSCSCCRTQTGSIA